MKIARPADADMDEFEYGSVVVAKWALGFRRMAASPIVDPLLAAVLLVATEVELWGQPVRHPGPLARMIALMAGAVTCVPLAWRRRAPLAVVVCVLASVAVPYDRVLFRIEQHGQGPVTPFLATILAVFSFGAYGKPIKATSAVVLVSVAAAGVVFHLAGNNPDPGFWVALTIFWGLGRLFRERIRRVAELEDHTVQLQRNRDADARAAVADERARISRELHDVVAHSVSVMVIQAGAARHTLDPTNVEMNNALASIESAGRQALVELRRLLGILRRADDEPALAPVPGMAQLSALVQQMRDAGLPAELHIEGQETPLPPGIDLAAYRIVQEALTNSLKHARARRAEVVIRYRPHQLELDVVDDGPAGHSARPNRDGAGHGLIGMRERVSIYGGVLDAGPNPGGGFAVHVSLPLERIRT